ncbi:hypothetical protein ACFXKY_08155 [Streptomyces canus]|uniref:hypothetical protein n=1 Tax=Streptomyces canus TaxID=58343 RepID=UPI0036A95A82
MASFSDDFNRADSSDLGAGWVEVSGDWSIIGNRLSSGSAGGTIILRAAGAMASNDHYAQVTIAATAAVSHGVWIRGNSNISQGYLFRNDGSSWNLFQVVGGSFTVIGTYAVAASAGDVAKLQAVGSTITAYVNGVQRINVTDTAVPTGTNVGIRAESAGALRFDDFSAAEVTAGATLGTVAETDTAQALAGAKAGTLPAASESDAATTLTGTKAATVGMATETETAQPLSGSKTTALDPAAAVETAQPLTGAKAAALAPAVETDTAQALSGTSALALGVAESTETAVPVAGAKNAALAPALEADTARPMAPPSASVPSVQRTFTVLPESRRLIVPAEHRRLTVVPESRIVTVR